MSEGSGVGEGERLHQGFLLDRGRHQRRPGPALHRQGGNDAARRLGVRNYEGDPTKVCRQRARIRHFPTVPGGKGDPKNIVGNPTNYFSISSKATDEEKTVAKAYFTEGLFTDTVTDAFIQSGQVPIAKSAEPKLAS